MIGSSRAVEDVAGASELDQGVAIVPQPCRKRGSDVVGASRDDRNAGGQSGCRRPLAIQVRRRYRSVHGPAENSSGRDRPLPAARAPRHALAEIVEPGFDRPVQLEAASGGAGIAKPGGDQVVRAQDGLRSLPGIRLISLNPEQPRRNVLLVGVAAGQDSRASPGRCAHSARRLRRPRGRRFAGSRGGPDCRPRRAAPWPGPCR